MRSEACVFLLTFAAFSLSSVCAQRIFVEGAACRRVAGVLWRCKKQKDCPNAQEMTGGSSPGRCGSTSNNEELVCCAPVMSEPNKQSPDRFGSPGTLSNSRPGIKSEQMCRKYAESVFKNEMDLCAMTEPMIVNGTNAKPKEFPHMALIGYGNEQYIRWSCGGSLISERWVLSAAHCTKNSGYRMWARLGEYNHRSTDDDNSGDACPQDFQITTSINHPNYNSRTYANDIALHKLEKDVEFSGFIRPICLQTERLPKKNALITGWGSTQYGVGVLKDILQKGNVTIITGDHCRSNFRGTAQEIDDRTVVCADNFWSTTDVCHGDSGGPLQFRLKNPYCMYMQVGITSLGIACGPQHPGIYTRVSSFIPWIESYVWPSN